MDLLVESSEESGHKQYWPQFPTYHCNILIVICAFGTSGDIINGKPQWTNAGTALEGPSFAEG